MIGNLPTEHSRSPWAVIIILIIALLFGLFWFNESRRLQDNTQTTPIAASEFDGALQTTANELDLSSLEASAVNIAIPSFEVLFP